MTTEIGRVRTGMTTVDSVVISYREIGAVSANPAVLLHGLGSSASTWDGFATVMAEAGGQAIAVDARGHGNSSPAEEYSLELMVADLLGFLDQRRLDRVDLIGHSMGGSVA
jgi:pimeloyl-ACP methyl ester carboxylesterase